MSNHMAVVTVDLPRPLKGSELIRGVKEFIGEDGSTSFVHKQSFDNGDIFIIGQYSGYPNEHILVAPSREVVGIRPDVTYDTVEVMDTRWPGKVYCVGYSDDAPINAVRKFAENLKNYLGDQAEVPEVSVWPQEVKVCAICEHIVRPNYFDVGSYCSTDGKNPPLKVVKVVPVVE